MGVANQRAGRLQNRQAAPARPRQCRVRRAVSGDHDRFGFDRRSIFFDGYPSRAQIIDH